jgi:hypothetical protein
MFNVMMVLSALLMAASTPAMAGQSGNGGGGVLRNGVYMTFGSAGLWASPVEKKQVELPNLDALIDQIMSMDCFSTKEKSALYGALAPSADRKYFDAVDSQYDQKTKDQLIAEYAKVIHAPSGNLVLFAITDTSSKRTYLLPEFYRLKPNEQMAILFHEAFWILYPKSTYDEVIRAEVAMQKYLESPTSADAVAELVSVLPGELFDKLYSAVQIDAKGKVANGIKSMGQNSFRFVSYEFFVGADFRACIQAQVKESTRTPADCNFLIERHWAKLKKTYWNSAAISLLADAVQNQGLRFSGMYSTSSSGSTPSKTSVAVCDRLGQNTSTQLSCTAIGGYHNERYDDWDDLGIEVLFLR